MIGVIFRLHCKSNHFYCSFPTNTVRREHWFVNIPTLVNQCGPLREGVLICSDHFEESSYITTLEGKVLLSDTAVPTLLGVVRPR